MDKKCSEADQLLQAGYQLFAEGGANLMSVSQMSRNTGLSLHKFHYFFYDRSEFLIYLLKEHERRIALFRYELYNCSSYIPGVFHLLSNYPAELRFHRQLLLGKKYIAFRFLYEKLNKSLNELLYCLWAEYIEYTGSIKAGKRIHLMLIDLWLLHLDPHTLSYNALLKNTEYISLRLQGLSPNNI